MSAEIEIVIRCETCKRGRIRVQATTKTAARLSAYMEGWTLGGFGKGGMWRDICPACTRKGHGSGPERTAKKLGIRYVP